MMFVFLLITACSKTEGPHRPLEDSTGGPGAPALGGAPKALPGGGVSYAQVSPIFKQRCSGCHHDTQLVDPVWVKDMTKDGKNSNMYKYVVEQNPKPMPPLSGPKSKEITDSERKLIGQWTLQGAPMAGAAPMTTATPVEKDAFLVTLEQCWSCHNADGKTKAETTPVLAGMLPEYFIKTLEAYKSDARKDITTNQMNDIAKKLSTDEIKRLATYFSLFKLEKKKEADELEILPSIITYGEKSECITCHTGTDSGSYPSVHWQNRGYIENQLRAYQNGSRSNKTMQRQVKDLSPQEIKDLALWYSRGAPTTK